MSIQRFCVKLFCERRVGGRVATEAEQIFQPKPKLRLLRHEFGCGNSRDLVA